MKLTPELENMGFCLADMNESDADDFICVDKASYIKYINQYYGEYKEEIALDNFCDKRKLTFFKKILLNDETVGFLNYDQKEDKIDSVSIRIIEKAQNNGLGTLFVSHLISLSKKFRIPVYIEAIKTNPVQNLYKRLGFRICKKTDIIYFFIYESYR